MNCGLPLPRVGEGLVTNLYVMMVALPAWVPNVHIFLFALCMKIVIYCVYHDTYPDDLPSWAIPLKIPSTAIFESAAYQQIVSRYFEWNDADFVGMITSTYPKRRFQIDHYPKAIEEHKDKDAIFLTKFPDGDIKHLHWFDISCTYHPLLFTIWRKLLAEEDPDLGVTIRSEMAIHSYWVAKPSVFLEYYKFFASKLVTLMQIEEVYYDSGYIGSLCHEPGRRTLIEMCGLPYYPHFPFILERLIGFFCSYKGLNVLSLDAIEKT